MPAVFRRYEGKPSATETQERRLQVFRLLMRGVKKSVIANTLGVNPHCVSGDVKWIKANLREMALNADTFTEAGLAAAELQEAKQEAMYCFSQTSNPHAKNQFLLTAIQAIEKRLKIMMDAGIIDRAPTVLLDIDVAKLSTVELLKRREQMLERLAGMGMGGLVAAPKTILMSEPDANGRVESANGHGD